MVAIWAHEDPALTNLVIEGEFIATTPTHLFCTTEGWVEAGELGEDAYVVRAGGAPGQVWESLTFTHPRQMYDLTVAEAHTFFVGEQQWLVHNCGGNTVYQSFHADGTVEYVGITNNYKRRAAEHLANDRVIEPIAGMTDLSRYDARNVEGALIVQHGRVDIDPTGTLSNQYHSISPRRTDYDVRLRAGQQIIRSSGVGH